MSLGQNDNYLILEFTKLKDENAHLKAEVERLTALVESNLNSSKVAMGKADAVLHERDSLKAEVERLRKACELVFDESAKRKFLMCYRGDDFYVSLQAMEAMSEALGYKKSKEIQS